MNNAFCTDIDCSQAKSVEDICDKIASALYFPDYYGRNFNAWNDCMTDLSWIEEKDICVRLKYFNPTQYTPAYFPDPSGENFPRIDNSSTRFLYRILLQVCSFWSDEHFVEAQYTEKKRLCFIVEGTDETYVKFYSHEGWLGK